MVVNKIEYHQIRKYLLFVVLAGLIYSVYSIVVVYYDNKAIKAGPIKSYEIVSKHSGAINISSYIIVRYKGKDYTVTVSRKDINEGKLYKVLYYNEWNDDIWVRVGILLLGLISISFMYRYIKQYHGRK